MNGPDNEYGNSTSAGRALIVHPQLKTAADNVSRLPEAQLAEAEGLASAIGLEVVVAEVIVVNRPRPATLSVPARSMNLAS